MQRYTDAIRQIKEALDQNPGAGLVIYGAGKLGEDLIEELLTLGLKPLCVCDENARLWGTRISGIEVISIDEAKQRFTNFLLYIASGFYLYEIIYQLLERHKAEKEKIINYVPVEKKYSCRFLEEGCVVWNEQLRFCCGDFGRKEPPAVFFDGNYDKLIDDFFALREKTGFELRAGIPNDCTGCRELSDIYTSRTDKVNMLNFTGFERCNFKCIYCKGNNQPHPLRLPELAEALRHKERLTANAVCLSASGEITIHRERNKLYKILATFRESQIFTNALVFDPGISELLRSGKSKICVSLDAGTQETFKKVKGKDVFDRVCTTLRRYSQESPRAIRLKYILLPGINDNTTDIDGFFALADELKVQTVIISSDINNSHLIGEKLIEMAKYFHCKANEMLLDIETNCNILSSLTGVRNTY